MLSDVSPSFCRSHTLHIHVQDFARCATLVAFYKNLRVIFTVFAIGDSKMLLRHFWSVFIEQRYDLNRRVNNGFKTSSLRRAPSAIAQNVEICPKCTHTHRRINERIRQIRDETLNIGCKRPTIAGVLGRQDISDKRLDEWFGRGVAAYAHIPNLHHCRVAPS